MFPNINIYKNSNIIFINYNKSAFCLFDSKLIKCSNGKLIINQVLKYQAYVHKIFHIDNCQSNQKWSWVLNRFQKHSNLLLFYLWNTCSAPFWHFALLYKQTANSFSEIGANCHVLNYLKIQNKYLSQS